MTPSLGTEGDKVTLSGIWRTGASVQAVCFWRLADGRSYQPYRTGTMKSNGDIECVVPFRTSAVSGVPAPSVGDTVYVTIAVYDESVGDDKRHSYCWSGQTELGFGSAAAFTYKKGSFKFGWTTSASTNSISRSTITSSSSADVEKAEVDDEEAVEESGSSLSVGLVAGVAVGGVLVVAVIIAAARMHRKKSKAVDIEVRSHHTSRESLVVRNANHCQPEATYEEPSEAYYDSDPIPAQGNSYEYAMPSDHVVYHEATPDSL